MSGLRRTPMTFLPAFLLQAWVAAAFGMGQEPEPSANREQATITGRFLLPAGEPAEGVQVVLHFSSERDRDQTLEARSDGEGRFALAFHHEDDLWLVLEAELPGYCREVWSGAELSKLTGYDLGEIRLVRGGTIRGRVVDASGHPVTGKVQVTASSYYRPAGAPASLRKVQSQTDPETGEFVLESVPPGAVSLTAVTEERRSISGQTIRIRAGETHRVELVDLPPAKRESASSFGGERVSSNEIEVRAAFLERIRPGEIHLHDAEGHRYRPVRDEDPSALRFEVEAGRTYTLEIDAPGFESVSRTISAGGRVSIDLVGTAAVELVVTDSVSGARVTGAAVRARYERPYQDIGLIPDADRPALYRGLVPGDLVLVIDQPGRALLELPVEDLEPGETRTLEVTLQPGNVVRGVVQEPAGGAPLPEIEVTMHHIVTAGDGFGPRHWSTRTDADGLFELQGVSPGTYDVVAHAPVRLWPPDDEYSKRIYVGTRPLGVVLEMPREAAYSGSLSGRITGIASELFPLLRVRAVAVAPDRDRFHVSWYGDDPGRVGTDGTFQLDSLMPGTYQLSARIDTGAGGTTFESSDGSPQPVLATVRILPGGEKLVELDLGRADWRMLTVRARLDGEPATGLLASLAPPEEKGTKLGWGWPPEPIRQSIDASGIVVFGPVGAGEHSIAIAPASGEWTWRDTVFLSASENSTLEVDLESIEHTVRVVEASSGEPWPLGVISLERQGHGSSRFFSIEDSRRRLDDVGRVRLSAPEGAVVRIGAGRGGTYEDVVWTSEGPEPALIRLERRD